MFVCPSDLLSITIWKLSFSVSSKSLDNYGVVGVIVHWSNKGIKITYLISSSEWHWLHVWPHSSMNVSNKVHVAFSLSPSSSRVDWYFVVAKPATSKK